MMKQMRENTKVILWIVVAAFVVTIFAVWGLDLQTGGVTAQGPNLVGRVDGVPITPQAYQSVYTQLSQQYRDASPTGQLDAATQEAIRDQAWKNIVSRILTEKEIDRLGITVTDEEVLAFLRNSPPTEVRQYFVDENGNFDFAAYQAALNNPDADWTAVEQLARQRIPMVKLNQYLLAQVHVGRDEILRKYNEENTRMIARYVAFPIDPEDTGGWAPTDADIDDWYREHPEDFTEPARAAVDFVRIPIEPTEQDREDIAALIQDLRADLESGIEFGELASTFSEAPSASQGGDAGFVRADNVDPAIATALGGLEPGAVSGPVWTEDAVYLVQLVEKRESNGAAEYHMKEIEVSIDPGPATVDSLVAAARSLSELAVKTSLSEAAAQLGYTVEATLPFPEDVPIPSLGLIPAMSRFAFSHEAGSVSPVISDDRNYYVCSVGSRILSDIAPLDNVRERIRATLLENRARDRAMREADAFFRSVSELDADFGDTALKYNLAVAKTDTFSVRDIIGDHIPRYSTFAFAALEAPNVNRKLLVPPVESDGVVYVINVLYRSPMDVNRFEGQAEAIRDRIYQRKVQQYIGWWYEQLMSQGKIEDLRDAL